MSRTRQGLFRNRKRTLEDKSDAREWEERLRNHYRREGEAVGGDVSLWPGIARQLPKRRLERRWPRPVALTALAMSLLYATGAGAVYFAPRLELIAYAMIYGSKGDTAALQAMLVNDPGLEGIWRAHAFHPIDLSITKNGIRLTLLDFFADANRTVVLYRLQVVRPPRKKGPVVQNWGIASDNSEQLSPEQLSGGQTGMGAVKPMRLKIVSGVFGGSVRDSAQSCGRAIAGQWMGRAAVSAFFSS